MFNIGEIVRELRRQWWLVLVAGLCVAGLLAALLSGCGKSHAGSVSSGASAVASDPEVQKAVKTVEKRAQGCLAMGNLVTRGGRKKFISCASGGKDAQAVERCLTTAVGDHGVLTKGQRKLTLEDFATCVAGLSTKAGRK